MAIFLILCALLAGAFIYFYNRLVRSKQLLKEAESGIDVQLKRRHDLIPNLIEVVKGYAAHEKNVLEEVTRARGQAQGAVSMEDKQAAEKNLSQVLKSIFAISEAYPNLKADQSFLALQTTLSDTEDQIQMARRYYNGTVRDLNVLVQSFPGNVVAGAFQFKSEAFFEIESATEKAAPQVKL